MGHQSCSPACQRAAAWLNSQGPSKLQAHPSMDLECSRRRGACPRAGPCPRMETAALNASASSGLHSSTSLTLQSTTSHHLGLPNPGIAPMAKAHASGQPTAVAQSHSCIGADLCPTHLTLTRDRSMHLVQPMSSQRQALADFQRRCRTRRPSKSPTGYKPSSRRSMHHTCPHGHPPSLWLP